MHHSRLLARTHEILPNPWSLLVCAGLSPFIHHSPGPLVFLPFNTLCLFLPQDLCMWGASACRFFSQTITELQVPTIKSPPQRLTTWSTSWRFLSMAPWSLGNKSCVLHNNYACMTVYYLFRNNFMWCLLVSFIPAIFLIPDKGMCGHAGMKSANALA